MVKTAVILAAGMGTRLNHLTADKPKGFLEIDGDSLIERSIKIIKKNSISNIIIGTGYLSHFYDDLKKKHPDILTCKNEIFSETSSFFTLYNMRGLINEDFLLFESDLLYEERAVSCLQENPLKDVILASGTTHSQDEVYIETDKKMMLVNMSKNKKRITKISGELVGISKISLETFQNVCRMYDGDEDALKKLDYEMALTHLSKTHPIPVNVIEDLAWTEIDTIEHLRRAKSLIYPKILKNNNL